MERPCRTGLLTAAAQYDTPTHTCSVGDWLAAQPVLISARYSLSLPHLPKTLKATTSRLAWQLSKWMHFHKAGRPKKNCRKGKGRGSALFDFKSLVRVVSLRFLQSQWKGGRSSASVAAPLALLHKMIGPYSWSQGFSPEIMDRC